MRDTNSTNPDEPSYWPVCLPPRERVRKVQDMLKAGKTWSQVTRYTGISPNRIGYIKSRPDMWDTVDDEVAIERAVRGDRSVLASLTLYERERVRQALAERMERDPYLPGVTSHHWLAALADNWGVDRDKLYNRLNQFNSRARRRAAA